MHFLGILRTLSTHWYCHRRPTACDQFRSYMTKTNIPDGRTRMGTSIVICGLWVSLAGFRFHDIFTCKTNERKIWRSAADKILMGEFAHMLRCCYFPRFFFQPTCFRYLMTTTNNRNTVMVCVVRRSQRICLLLTSWQVLLRLAITYFGGNWREEISCQPCDKDSLLHLQRNEITAYSLAEFSWPCQIRDHVLFANWYGNRNVNIMCCLLLFERRRNGWRGAQCSRIITGIKRQGY